MKVRLASAQWSIAAPADFSAFAARITAEVATAVQVGAQLIVLPEYLALELQSTLAKEIGADVIATLAALQPLQAAWLDLFSGLARRHRVHLLAGTFLHAQANGFYRNRAWLFSPEGNSGFQDKLTLTGFENALRVIEPGDALRVFDCGFARVAINVCYDVEFPLYARAQQQAGARLLLVPSCTDTEAGATRVRVGCMARALENRFFVAQSVTAGEAPDNPSLDTNTGFAAIYAPSDRGLPADGVVARAYAGTAWLFEDIDLAALDDTLQAAQVRVPTDWSEQFRPDVARARVQRID